MLLSYIYDTQIYVQLFSSRIVILLQYLRAFYDLQFRHFSSEYSNYMQYLCKSDFQFTHENAGRKRNRAR